LRLEFPRTIPDEYLRAIGCVVNEWSYMEVLIDNALATISELKRSDALVLLTHLQTETKLNSISNILTQKTESKTLLKKWETTISEIRRLKSKRNLIVHSNWMFQTTLPAGTTKMETSELLKHPTSIIGTHIHAKGKETKSRNIHVIAETIENLANDIRNIQNNFITLIGETAKACKFDTEIGSEKNMAQVKHVKVDI